ncbi:MAG TPA: SdrD B-like domain-containing protein, partial [Pirellulaceae bacterium]|nr:SdrD B-like domain-containing protein [Pirellulaceae bacterium]
MLAVAVTGNDLVDFRSTASNGGLVATDGWTEANGGFKIAWNIFFSNDAQKWSYTYTFTDGDGTSLDPDQSHWLLEVSESITADNVDAIITDANFTFTDPQVWTKDPKPDPTGSPGANNANPLLPADIYAIKVNNSTSSVNGTFQFLSTRIPVWGDFYGKNGSHDGIVGTVWNVGIGTDPTTADTDFTDWIPTPDTIEPGTKSGTKFEDHNGNGVRDLGDQGLSGWTIYVDYNNNGQLDSGEPSDVTDANGDYTILNINPGTWRIREVLQPGWLATFPAASDAFGRYHEETFAAGSVFTGNDFGNFQLITINGQKFNDLDGDGIQDLGEPGLANWTIELDAGADGTVDATTVTDASGNYSFTNLGPGTYRIREVQQAGWTQTTVNPADIAAISGQNVSGVNFGNFQLITISGQKFNDLNDDGVQDLGEPGLLGWTIQLDAGADGTVDATTVTDASGNYSFTNLGTGTYRIREVQQATWTQTTANPADIAAVSGTNVAGINFGNTQALSISGQKFNDLDGDGIQDVGEPGLSNWTIELDANADGSVDATTVTDASGNYTFANLSPGTYRIREVQQAGWMQTTVNPADIVAVSGQSVSDIDFGNFQLITISGQKFNDLDGDGNKEADENGLANWTIELDLGADGTVDASTTTDANGNYSFTNLGPGVYRIREVQQAQWVQTTVNPADITAQSGVSVGDVDFGNVFPVTPEEEGDILVIGPDKSPTAPAPVLVLDQTSGSILTSFLAYEANFVGGTRVATGDINGDGIDEIITAPGRGRAPEVRVFTQQGVELTEYRTMAYLPKFKGGVQVAVGDVNGDGRMDIVTAPSSGKAEIRVFLGQDGADPIANTPFKKFKAFGAKFVGGAFVRAADMGTRLGNGTFNNTLDGKAEIIVGSGPGIKAAIKIFHVNATPVAVRTINPFTIGKSVYKNGVNFDVADLNGDSVPDLVVGTENGGNSRVETFVWNGSAQLLKTGTFMAYGDSPSKIAPVRVAANDSGQFAAVQGPNGTTQQLRIFETLSINPLSVAPA